LSNYRVNPTDIEVRKRIAFVAQDDALQITATPREAIRFSAKLRKPKHMTEEELERLTSRMLEALGLDLCADVLVGGALLKGISGGERKRTSVGVELVASPALVFLDEPTSGLDSYNAQKLCQLLKKIAGAGSSVLFTIHQPSSDIFSSFDRVILLNQGKVMYQGSVPAIPDYFEARGFPLPSNYNPADHVMNVALTNSIEQLNQAGFFPVDERNAGEPLVGSTKEALGIQENSDSKAEENPGFAVQARMLFRRELLNTKRNTHAIKTRFGMTVIISSVIGALFYQVAQLPSDDYTNVQTTFGALLISMLSNVFATAMPSLLSFPEERPVFLREYSTNHYSVASYFLSRLTMELVVNGIQVTVSSLVTYHLIGFNSEYGVFWSAIYLMANASNALGVLVGSAVENPSTAIEFLPAMFMPQILFSGFFIPPDLMPVWLAWIPYICPLTYGVRIVVVSEFDGRCLEGESYPSGRIDLCDQMIDNVGAEVDDIWWYFLVLFGLFVCFRLLALILLNQKASRFY